MTPGAIAVFAKTPGLSAVKTRLAAQIGVDKARAIYESSLVATAAVLRAAADADGWRIFFALAEADGVGDRFWRAADFAGFRFMASGAGGLGERLDFVSRALLAEGESAVLIGADSPNRAVDFCVDARPRESARPRTAFYLSISGARSNTAAATPAKNCARKSRRAPRVRFACCRRPSTLTIAIRCERPSPPLPAHARRRRESKKS